MSDPNFALSDFVSPIPAEEWEASIYALLERVGTSTTSWQPWAPTKALIRVMSIVLAALSFLVSQIASAGYLHLAPRSWLPLLARHKFGVTDIQAQTFARTSVTLTNAGTGVFNPGPGEWVFENPSTGSKYTNDAAFSLGVGATTSVPVTCTAGGSIGTSTVGTITRVVTSATGVACTNPTSAIGLEAATSEEIIALCVARRDSRSSSGPKGGYDYAARVAKRIDGSSIGVNRVRVYAPGDSTVSIFVATPNGEVDGVQTNPNTDIGRVRLSVEDTAETQGVEPNVYSATGIAFDVSYEVYCFSNIAVVGFDGPNATERLKAAITQRLAVYLNKVPIGGFTADAVSVVFADAIATTIAQISPSIFRVKVLLPSDIFVVGAGKFPELASVTGSVFFVPVSEVS